MVDPALLQGPRGPIVPHAAIAMRSPRSDSLPLSMCPKFLAPTCSSTSLTAHASDNYGDVLCAGARERAFQAYHQLRPKLSGRPSQGVGSLATPRRQNAPQHRLAAPHSALPCESFALRWRKGAQSKSPLKPSHKAHRRRSGRIWTKLRSFHKRQAGVCTKAPSLDDVQVVPEIGPQAPLESQSEQPAREQRPTHLPGGGLLQLPGAGLPVVDQKPRRFFGRVAVLCRWAPRILASSGHVWKEA